MAMVVATLTLLLLVEGLAPSLRLDRGTDFRQQQLDLLITTIETNIRACQLSDGYASLASTAWSYAGPANQFVISQQVSAPWAHVKKLVVQVGPALAQVPTPVLAGNALQMGVLIREP